MKEQVVIALGVFDGVHRGHQKIVKELKDLALRAGCTPLIATFEPNPLEILDPSKAPKRLTSREKKLKLLKDLGDVKVNEFSFDQRIAHMSGVEFWSYLKNKYDLSGVVVGFNFHFGNGARWDGKDLLNMADEDRLICRIVKAYIQDGEAISSTRIRNLIAAGEIEQANKLLGRSYRLYGPVVSGQQFGRTMEFPTANIQVDSNMQKPLSGVYITRTKINDTWHWSMTNIGKNPTVNESNRSRIETHILDFSGNLYDREIDVEFHKRLRDEKAFRSVDDLRAQLQRDKDAVKNYCQEEVV